MKVLIGPGLHDPKGNEAFLVAALKRAADVQPFSAGLRWEQIEASLPAGWTPDVIIIRDAEFYHMPVGIEKAEYPIVGLIGDYNLSLNQMLPVVGVFDYFFCDTKGLRIFRKLGFNNCDFFCLYGYDSNTHKNFGLSKDIDVVFIGNLSSGIQQERDEYIYQLARLDRKYKVLITTGVFGDEYVHLLNRSHLVFNRSIRDEVNMRFFEALACGAVVMNNYLDELRLMGFVANEHYLEYDDVAEGVDRFFQEWTAENRAQMVQKAAGILAGHSYDDRAAQLLARIAQLDLNPASRLMRELPEKDASNRWERYLASEVNLPGLGKVPRFHPIVVNWSKQLLSTELEMKGFDFAMWSWWIELLQASGLEAYLSRFLAERLALLDRFECFQEEAGRIKTLLNRILYGFSID